MHDGVGDVKNVLFGQSCLARESNLGSPSVGMLKDCLRADDHEDVTKYGHEQYGHEQLSRNLPER